MVPAPDYVPPDPPVMTYLIVDDGKAALEWYGRALGAEVTYRIDEPDGRVGHAMLSINGGAIYLADEFPELGDRVGVRAPKTLGGASAQVALAVHDTDSWVGRAVEAGAQVLRPAVDDFYGRAAKVRDPFGHVWTFVGPKTTG